MLAERKGGSERLVSWGLSYLVKKSAEGVQHTILLKVGLGGLPVAFAGNTNRYATDYVGAGWVN